MTGVMPFVDGFHGFKWQVVTGFTLGFWRRNINFISLRGQCFSTRHSTRMGN